jgi:hypothetical protein
LIRDLLPVLALFVAIDVLAVLMVVRRKFAQSGVDFTKVAVASRLVHQRVGDYMRANYGGHPEQLPTVLRDLLPIAAEVARSVAPIFDDHIVELMVKTSIATHHFATRAEVEAALREMHTDPSVARAA